MDLSFQPHAPLRCTTEANQNWISQTTYYCRHNCTRQIWQMIVQWFQKWNMWMYQDAWIHSSVFVEISDCQGETWRQGGQTCHSQYVLLTVQVKQCVKLSVCDTTFHAVACFMFCPTIVTLLYYWGIIVSPDKGSNFCGFLIYSYII
jgi:hypothetical protein